MMQYNMRFGDVQAKTGCDDRRMGDWTRTNRTNADRWNGLGINRAALVDREAFELILVFKNATIVQAQSAISRKAGLGRSRR
jgi:hypothetical protein